MAKKQTKTKNEPAETVTIPNTIRLEASKPHKHVVTLMAGQSYTVVDDGSTVRDIDDVSKTIWRSRAEALPSPESDKGITA